MEEKLEHLMIASPFDDLPPADREYVMRHMSEADYNACHEVLPRIMSGFARTRGTLIPDPGTLERLKAGLGERSLKRSRMYFPVGSAGVGFSTTRFRVAASAILVAAAALLIWIPVTLSHKTSPHNASLRSSNAGPEQAVRAGEPLHKIEPEAAPRGDRSELADRKAAPVHAAEPAPPSGGERGLSEKYLCYDITFPAPHGGKNPDVHGSANSPGLHAGLLIPDSDPVQVQPRPPKPRD